MYIICDSRISKGGMVGGGLGEGLGGPPRKLNDADDGGGDGLGGGGLRAGGLGGGGSIYIYTYIKTSNLGCRV